MKATTKRNAIASLAAACALTLCTGLLISSTKTVSAEETSGTYAYYYEHITLEDGAEKALAKKFYEALDEMNAAGDFKDGVVSYSLSEILTSDQIGAWVTGRDVSIPRSFSAARDSYYMDHPELFYIDIYKMTISAAQTGDVYSAYIDCGREANLYADDGFTSEGEVDNALTAYSMKVDEIANYAIAEANKEQYGTAKKVLQARYVNSYIAANTEYDDLSAADSAITTASPAQTAYGALVKGKAVCNGYTRAFKAVMDKLGIPCIVVNGYSISRNSQGETVSVGEGHAWNYVWFEIPVEQDDGGIATQADEGGAWYGYDVTWNSTGNNANAYIDMGNFSMLKEHSPDGEVSTSGYLVEYPALSNYNYGCQTDSNGIVYSINYVGNGEPDDFGNEMVEVWVSVTYNGKGAVKLFEEDGLRIISRMADMGKDGVQWTEWIDLYAEIKVGPLGGANEFGNPPFYTDIDTETKFCVYGSVLYIQFAVLDGSEETGIKPDASRYGGFENIKTGYNPETDLSEYLVVLSDMAANDSYLTYVPAPHVVTSIPDHKQINLISQSWAIPGTNQFDDQYAFDIFVTYHEPLKVLDTTKPIGVSFTSASLYGTRDNIYDYAHFVPLSEDENGEKIWVELIGEGEKKDTLHFKFAPSLMYEHNGMHYYYTFTNVGSAYENYRADGTIYVSEKTPNILIERFFREYIACNKCLPNGRMLLDCVAQPTLISNTDLSEVNFQDEEGNFYSAGQRSQMMLVVNKPTKQETETMNELLDQNNDLNVSTEDIKAAETYEIDLQICTRYVYIPNGSYVKIALGFPEGYGPDDEGVTFKIYHYKRNEDRTQIIAVEEIPCVVTKFGIVATVQSFSPFMVVAVDADKATEKSIYASVDGNGGGLNNADGQIQTLKEGESYTYTIKPDDGYSVYCVTLNGQNVSDKIADGKLTLTYDELAVNNELEIKYISNAAALRYEQNNIKVVEPAKVVIGTDGTAQIVAESMQVSYEINHGTVPGNDGGNGGSNTTLIICLSVVAVVIVAAAATVVVLVMQGKKKKN